MAFPFLILYIVVSYIYPGQIFPALAPLRITYWVGIAGLVFSTAWLVVRRPAPLLAPQLWLLLTFTGVLGLSLMLAENWPGGVLFALLRFGPSLTMFVLAICSVDSLRKLKVAVGCVVVVTLAVMIQGAAAYHWGYHSEMFLFDPTVRTEYVGSEEFAASPDSPPDEFDSDAGGVRIRGLGLLHDPNDLALGFVVALALLAGVWRPGAAFRNAFIILVPGMALGYGVYLTHSRGGALGLLVMLLIGLGLGWGRLKALIAVAALVTMTLSTNFGAGRTLMAEDESARGRVEAWTEGLEMLKARPIFGVGYGQFVEHHNLTAHNSLVLCFAETGLVGYSIWLAFIILTLVQLQRLRSSASDTTPAAECARWARALQLAIVGFMAGAFFLSRTFVPMLYLIVGLSVALVLISRRSDRPGTPVPIAVLCVLVAATELASIGLVYVAVKLHIV